MNFNICAHYAIHGLKIWQGVLDGKSPLDPIDRKEKAFIYGSIDIHVEKESKAINKVKK